MTALASDRAGFLSEIRRISRDVAAVHADEVDRAARFPLEAVDALRDAGALSALVPAALGGGGLQLGDVALACRELARGCSATAMVYAMHQLQIANIVRHSSSESWHADYLAGLCTEPRLISSVTSEVGTGGDMSRSIAALIPGEGGRLSFEKQAPTVSYGAHCDDLMTTVRRTPEAAESDQVMVLHSREATDLVVTGAWDTLGMRGTCSPGFTVRTEVAAEQVLDEPFAEMMSQTIVPVSHILWANVWLGIAIEAFERGRAFVRAAARRAPGQPVPAARRLSEVLLEVRLLRAEVDSAVADFERWDATPNRAELATMAAGVRFNALKLVVSERVPGICTATLAAIGIMGYKNDSAFSVGRLLRDALSGQLMITNDRLHAANAGMLAVLKGDV